METSEKQKTANKKNALQSTGPKTPEGKARSSQNALVHGLRAASPVLSTMEREEDWQAHRAAILGSLTPAPGLEIVLAERIALHLWRLDRVVRYETEAARLLQERVEEDLEPGQGIEDRFMGGERKKKPDPRFLLEKTQRGLRFLEDLEKDLSPERILDFVAVDKLVSLVDPWTLTDPDLTSFLAKGEDFQLKTVFEKLQTSLQERAEWTLDSIQELVAGLKEYLQEDEKRQLTTLANRETARDRLQRGRLLPTDKTLEKVSRYETHLSRQFHRDLLQLEHLQDRRATVIEVEETGAAQ